MGLIMDLQTDVESVTQKICDNYCKYSKECEEYCESRFSPDDEPKDERFENCPLMGLI